MKKRQIWGDFLELNGKVESNRVFVHERASPQTQVSNLDFVLLLSVRTEFRCVGE